MSKKFLFAMLAAVLSAGALTGCGKKSEGSKADSKPKQIKARTIAEDEKLGIKFSEDQKTLVKYNAELKDAEYAIPEGVTTIGRGAFQKCESLKSVAIPSSVTVIGDYAFAKCPNLANVTIPEGVTTIGRGAFKKCGELKSVKIPSSVKTIDQIAFGDSPCEESVRKQFPGYRSYDE